MKLLLVLGITMTLCLFVLSTNTKKPSTAQGKKNIQTETNIDSEYQDYMKKYNKKYTNTDMGNHKKVYMENKKMIEEHNKRYDNKQETYKMCLNKFADMLPNEFHAHKQPIAEIKNRRQKRQTAFYRPYVRNNGILNKTIDWRQLGAVTEVKDQDKCGSCWAHAATGAIEGQLFIKTKKLISLSEQNLLDCSTSNFGCDGGSPRRAYLDINNTIGGLVPSKDYPYEKKKVKCRYNPAQSVAKVVGYRTINKGDEEELKEAVATVGPIAIGMHACNDTNVVTDSFSFYCRGIYAIKKCCVNSSVLKLNHAVLLIGYGSENGMDYWIVKNSYGINWGENGYMRIKRGDNICGIAEYADYPIIDFTCTPSKSGHQTKLQIGTNLCKAASSAARSLRNTKFVMVLVFVALFCHQ